MDPGTVSLSWETEGFVNNMTYAGGFAFQKSLVYTTA